MKNIKQIAIFAFVVSMVFVPVLSRAAELKAVRDYTLQKAASVDGNLYLAAQNSFISGDINGDAVIASGNVLINGAIKQGALVAGGNVEILGNVEQSVRAIGGTVVIGETVRGDVAVAGGMVRIAPDAVVEGDVLVAAGQLIVDGVVKGNVRTIGGETIINGIVEKDVSVRADRKLTIGSEAKIAGNLSYRSIEAAQIMEGAQIQGEVKFEKLEQPKGGKQAIAGLIGFMMLIKLLIMLTVTILGVVLFKKAAQSLTKTVIGHFGREAVRGFVVLIVVPAALIVALASVIGIGLAVAGALIYLSLIMIAKVITGVVLGSVVIKLIKKTKEYEVNWQNAAIGVIAVELVSLVPILGWVAIFLLFIASLGSISLMAYQKMWLKR